MRKTRSRAGSLDIFDEVLSKVGRAEATLAAAADELVNKLENRLRTMSSRKRKKRFLIFG